METKTQKNTLPWIAVLSLIGAAVSIWQTRLFFNTRAGSGGMHSFCNIGQTFDCTAIEMSPYSEFFGGMPLSAVAIAGYLVILGLALYALANKQLFRNVLIAFTGIALLFSLFYLGVMITIIGKFCLLCLGIDLINILLFIFALKLSKEKTSSEPAVPVNQLLVSGAVAIVIAFLFTKALNPLADMKQEDVNDIVENVMAAPVVPITVPADAPTVGNADAKITIVKFSDYECPACRMAANALHPLFKRYPNNVRFVFMNYPLDSGCNKFMPRQMHVFACEAATVAICAHEQGKFIAAYETLFENQADFKTGEIANLVSSIPGLDSAKLKACMSLPSTSSVIASNVEFAKSVGVQSTPTFFINGRKIDGGLPTNVWIKIIDRLLAQ